MELFNFADAAWGTLQNVKLTDFHWVHVESIYRISSPYHFSWDVLILLKYWQLILKHFPRILSWILFDYDLQMLIFNCRWTPSTTLIFKTLIPRTSESSTVLSEYKSILHPCSANVGSNLRSFMTNLVWWIKWTHLSLFFTFKMRYI